MDDKLFDIFSEETTVPKCVLDRIDETLDTLERTEDKKKETRSTGGRTNRKNWKPEKPKFKAKSSRTNVYFRM